jgi:hypothetical protein
MNSKMIKWILGSLMAMAVLATPFSTRAADGSTNLPTAPQPAPLHKKPANLPYHGKLVSLDTKAKTLTVGTMVLLVSSHTHIVKDGQPATLEQGVVGENVSGAYRKSDDGKLHAVSIFYGTRPELKRRQPAGATNAVTTPN